MNFFRFIIAVAAIALCSTVIVSCYKSNDELLEDYQQVATEVVEATKAGDMNKVKSLSKLENELSKRSLSDKQEKRLMDINSKLASGMISISYDALGSALGEEGEE